jgi:hypothetical protein
MRNPAQVRRDKELQLEIVAAEIDGLRQVLFDGRSDLFEPLAQQLASSYTDPS